MEDGTVDTLHFCSGLPRAGSTLLMNILQQNPRLHCSSTSALCEVVMNVRNQWEGIVEFRTIPELESQSLRSCACLGLIQGYYSGPGAPVIIDKCRGWLAEIEFMEHLFSRKVKVLVPVRPILEVLASLETLHRKRKAVARVPQASSFGSAFATVQGRAEVHLRNDQLVGMPIVSIKDALARGLQDRMHFVEFDRLTKSPKTVLSEIYEFLDEEPFQHNFDFVEQTVIENDRPYGWGDLHSIRPKVEQVESDWRGLIAEHLPGNVLAAYKAENEFWKGR